MPKALPQLSDDSPVCCEPLGGKAEPLQSEDAVAITVRLKALADPARLQILDFLRRQPRHEACTCDLAEVVQLTEATTSHHLKQLFRAGLVSKRRDGLFVRYALVPDALTALAKVLADPA